MKKAVLSGEIQHVSATQITNYVSCPRLWFFDKIMGLRPEQTKAQAAGDLLHQQLDAFYKEGKAIVHEGLADAVSAYLPPPGEGVLSEHPHDYGLGITAADVPVKGRIDLLYFIGKHTPIVFDLKTKSKSSFGRYILTPQQLKENLQLVIYAKYCVEKYDARVVTVSHINVCKEGIKHKEVPASLSRDDILSKFEHLVVKPVEQMKECAKLTSPDSLPTLEDAAHKPCYAYGKCPFFANCFGQKDTPVTDMFSDFPSSAVVSAPALVQPATSLDFVLFVDCLPTKGMAASPLEDLIAKHSTVIAEKHKVTDVREVKFAVATSELIAAMKKETLVGAYTVSSTGLGGLVSEALLPLAKLVVRGVR